MDKRLRYFNSSLKECSKKTKIAVVGEKTAKTLDDFGIKADFIPPEFVAESLIDNFPVSGYGLRVFVPRVQTGGRDLIADQFRKAGSVYLRLLHMKLDVLNQFRKKQLILFLIEKSMQLFSQAVKP